MPTPAWEGRQLGGDLSISSGPGSLCGHYSHKQLRLGHTQLMGKPRFPHQQSRVPCVLRGLAEPRLHLPGPGQLSDHASRQKVPLAASSPGLPNIGEHEKQQLAWP